MEMFLLLLSAICHFKSKKCPFNLAHPAHLTSGEQDRVELQAASILKPTGQLAEMTAVQEHGDPQGLPAALHLVAHRCV